MISSIHQLEFFAELGLTIQEEDETKTSLQLPTGMVLYPVDPEIHAREIPRGYITMY